MQVQVLSLAPSLNSLNFFVKKECSGYFVLSRNLPCSERERGLAERFSLCQPSFLANAEYFNAFARIYK